MQQEIKIERHIYMPKHMKMDEGEAEEILKKLNITRKQLPRILKEDPAIANVEVKKGDIIKIIRNSPTIGESEYYRVVIWVIQNN